MCIRDRSYSIGNSSQSLSLVYQLSKYSFFIILFPAVPCILCMDTDLDLWLGNVPQYTSCLLYTSARGHKARDREEAFYELEKVAKQRFNDGNVKLDMKASSR